MSCMCHWAMARPATWAKTKKKVKWDRPSTAARLQEGCMHSIDLGQSEAPNFWERCSEEAGSIC